MNLYLGILALKIGAIILGIYSIGLLITVIREGRYDDKIIVKSARAVNSYDAIKYIKEDNCRIDTIIDVIKQKKDKGKNTKYVILVKYTSPAGRSTSLKKIKITEEEAIRYKQNPSLWMSASEYKKINKEHSKELLEKKQQKLYDSVNKIIDYANKYRDKLVIKGNKDELDKQVASLFDRTINSIKKIKDVNSEEWDILNNFISSTENNIKSIVKRNTQILEYYKSHEFKEIKQTCSSLMKQQKEFNKYIDEKAKSISSLFGTRVNRNETEVNDDYNYIRPYKKSITPFTAEVSSQVFASAENSPIEYIVKYFYNNKDNYPEQIKKLQTLIEELETLKDAKVIIDNYKKDYQQYISDVPEYVMQNDEDGFYSRLGFANISENVLTVEYKFSYTSNGGFAQRSFKVPMNEETIIELINILQSKLTVTAFAKEQRALMTSKLRQHIKERDDFTCKYCGNSTHKEPNLLLEIDHIIPVAKGGLTEENNLQTLCWKCNRSKSDKLIEPADSTDSE